MATFDAHKNFAYSLVATAPSPATSGTSLVVTAADGTKFPAVPFNAVIWPASVQPTVANAEVVRVTARSTDTLTITRTQESTSARTVIVGDQIAAAITAKTVTDIEAFLTANADGFSVQGGTSSRALTVSGANIAIVGSGTVTYTFPGSSGGNTLVTTGATQTLVAKTATALTIAPGDFANMNHTHASAAEGGKLPVYVTYCWGVSNLAGTATANLSFMGAFSASTNLSFGGAIGTTIKAPKAGSCVALVITADGGRTAGTATASFVIAGSGGTLTAVLNATDTQIGTAAQALGIDTFTAGQTLGIQVVTSGWTPTTAECIVYATFALTI